jgi:arylsulfatase A-like enzyme
MPEKTHTEAWKPVARNPRISPEEPYFSPYSFKAGTITPGKEREYIVDRLTDEAIEFIRANRHRPFFAAVWQFGVHGPWDHKEEYTTEFVGKQDPRGKQAILFTSDNGGNVHSNTASDGRKENVRPGHPQWRSLSSYRKYAGELPPTNNEPLWAGKSCPNFTRAAKTGNGAWSG